MKVVGIIAEYNPFHNGHAYQIKKAREITNADYVIVVMSGNYVQRGTPAITDKYARTRMALNNGADLVFELPVLWSTASAEYFAMAGITLLDKLGIVDFVSFGCETEKYSLLSSIARILANEPEDFSALLKNNLKAGMTYPVARENALFSYLQKNKIIQGYSDNIDTMHAVFSSPNNILGIEYCKALVKRNCSIQPKPILRTGAGYHETNLQTDLSSASALRKLLLSNNSLSQYRDLFVQNVPKDTADFFLDLEHVLLSEKDFSSMLYYKLVSEQSTGFAEYGDSSPFLSNRILNHLDSYLDFEQFCSLLKTKDVTHTRIQRLLLHILLNIRQKDYETGKKTDYIPWLRVLGFQKNASVLLKEIAKASSIPLLTKPAKARELLSAKAYAMYQKDVAASNLYYGTRAQKSHTPEKNEFQREIILSDGTDGYL